VEKIIPQLNRFKLDYWDHEGINLHSRDIRKATGPFSILQNKKLCERFLDDLTKLMEKLPYKLFITVINKQKHREKYDLRAVNPYELALTLTFERILPFLEWEDETNLPAIAEARGKNEDRDLKAAFYELLSQGTYYNASYRFNRLTCPLLFENKRKNVCGIQLADLCAYPSARHILKPGQENQAYEVVKKHIYRRGNIYGWETPFPRSPADRAFPIHF
jgi:hypothetical protein